MKGRAKEQEGAAAPLEKNRGVWVEKKQSVRRERPGRRRGAHGAPVVPQPHPCPLHRWMGSRFWRP